VIYLHGLLFKGILSHFQKSRTGILQSASRKVLEEGFFIRKVQVSYRVSLEYHQSGSRRVVTVLPDLADCVDDYQAVKALAEAIAWLSGLPEHTPRIAPFPDGKRLAAIFMIHGEGYSENMDIFQDKFSDIPGALTYAVSEGGDSPLSLYHQNVFKKLTSWEGSQISETLMVRWGLIGSTMPQNGLDTEFAIVHAGEEMLRDQTVKVTLPEALRVRISQALPTTMRVST